MKETGYSVSERMEEEEEEAVRNAFDQDEENLQTQRL